MNETITISFGDGTTFDVRARDDSFTVLYELNIIAFLKRSHIGVVGTNMLEEAFSMILKKLGADMHKLLEEWIKTK